ncbi:MAG: PilZ domain-containing protein [Nitrospirae bacterium]|nr:PilZ domain-containing protein [Nitrospirota bacterium]
MDQRISKRVAGKYRAEILYRNNIYAGVIENISWSGANVLTDPLDPEIAFLPDELLDLKFESPAGETVILKCKIIWSSKIPPGNDRNRIGMQLLERPSKEIAFFF